MKEIISTYVIPVVTIALTYVLGRLQSVQSDKKSAYKEAYETFYLPFISLLYETQIWIIGFSSLDRRDRHKLFQMVAGHIQYMDKAVLEYVDILYYHYGAVLVDESEDAGSIFTPDRLDELFDELTSRVLSRSTWLAKKLHQPPIGKFVLELYLENQAIREKERAEVKQCSNPNR